MILGIMSDTHDNIEAVSKALEIFRKHNVEAIIHLGDIVSPFTLMKIVEFPARIVAVLGNNDGDEALLREIAMKAGVVMRKYVHIMDISKRRILLMHGFGSVETTITLVNALAQSNIFDVILYGHTHKTDARVVGKTLVINPGEVCGYITGKRSVAVLDTATLEYRIIEF